MKLPILSFVLCLLTGTVCQAQDQTLLNRINIQSVGGFGGPILQVTQIGDQSAPTFGGGGGIVINNFFIGGFGGGTGTENWFANNEEYDIDIGYGGLWLGYSFLDDKLVHPYVSLQAAIGGLEIGRFGTDNELSEEMIGLVSPELGAEINLTDWFKFSTTIGYRWVNDFDKNDIIASEDIRNFYLGFNFRFGYFGN